jgi:Fe-S-cluster containining protein
MKTGQGNKAETVVALRAGDPDSEHLSTGQVVLVLGGEPVRFELTVPAGPAAVEDVLPVLQGLSSFLAERAAARAGADGRTVSCRAGCGACCRQLVPVSPSEARALAKLVQAMPEPRRTHVRRRFDEALETLAPSGVIDRLMGPIDEDPPRLGMDYFHQGVACPFLEDESCSIHPDRPLSCREYLVTSPADNCAAPTPETIQLLKLDADPSVALLKAEAAIGWTALVLSLRFADQPEPAEPTRSGPDILRDLFGQL